MTTRTDSRPGLQRGGARALLTFGLLLGLAACQNAPRPSISPEEVGEFRKGSGYLKGYLDPKALPDSLALLPPAPPAGSAREAADLEAHRSTRTLRGGARWEMAARDANLKWPAASQTFACALDVDIGPDTTPHLNMLLRRTLIDAGLATYRAKDQYKRTRPYVALSEPTCLPSEEEHLRRDGAYPSGHAALGWAWGLILAEIAPERADALVQRAWAFGQSRMVCAYHWQSDIDAGRAVGAAAVARLHADPVFLAQLGLAREELAARRVAGGRPAAAACRAEAEAMRP